MDPDGDFVRVRSKRDTNSPADGVFAQRFDASGQLQGPEIQVSSTPELGSPDVAMDAAGNFVVTWSGLGPAGPGVDVHARRYDAAGNPLGNDFRVNTFTTSGQAAPSIAMDADGDFVVAWGSYYQDGAGAGVFAQRYAASGAPPGGELQVNSFTTGPQRSPDVAMNASGDYVVTWESFDQDGSSIGVFARVYDRNGTRMTNELPVNTFTTNTQSSAAVAADDEGNFVVTWVSRDQDGSSDGIYAKRFEATGAPRGGEFRVNTFTPGAQTGAAVDVDADGDFVVTWQTRPQGEADYNIYAQRYNAAGATQGDEFLVNTFTTSSQGGAVVASDADGDFVVAWGSNPQDGSGSGVYAQRFAAGASTAAPAVAASAFLFATAPQRLTFRFDQDVSASLGIPDLTVQQLPGGPTITPSTLSYDGTTNTATFTFGSVLPDGRYRATLSAAGITNASGTPLAADHVFTFHFLRGDANGDGAVNLLDFNRLAGNFGQSPRDFTQGDFNYDGTVNLQDFNLLAGRFGQSVAPAGAAPGWVGGRDDRSDELDDLLA